jgi:hypothetical protein
MAVGPSRSFGISTQRKAPHRPDDEAALTADVIELATTYGRYGYRRIAALLREAGWAVNVKRVAHLAAGGAESSAQATQAAPSMAQRRLVRAANLDHPMGANHSLTWLAHYLPGLSGRTL